MNQILRAAVPIAVVVAVAAGPARAAMPLGVEIVNRTASSASVTIETNRGRTLGAADIGAGATGHVEVWAWPETVRVKSRQCAAATQVYSRNARSFKITVGTSASGRCEVHVYPVG